MSLKSKREIPMIYTFSLTALLFCCKSHKSSWTMTLPWPSHSPINPSNWSKMSTSIISVTILIIVAIPPSTPHSSCMCVNERHSNGWPYSVARFCSCEQGGLSVLTKGKPQGHATGPVEPLIWSPSHHIQSAFYLLVCIQRGTYPSSAPSPLQPPTPALHNETESGPATA